MNHDERRTWPIRALLAAVLALSALGPTAARADDSGDDDGDQADWPMFNHDRAGTRTNPSETTLGTSSVSGLKVKWSFPTTLPVSGTPVVVDGVVYAGDMSGQFYALKSSDGSKLWSTQLGGSITASALVKGNVIVIGDLKGNLYGLARNTGAVVWSFKPDNHQQAAIFGSATQVGGYVAIGVASNEEAAAADPNYPCCSSRGSLVLLDPKDGTVEWQTYMITAAQKAAGASGSSIWSSPAYDPSSKLIYVTTGNNFSQPTTLSSDAIVAIDARNGAIVWMNQRYPNDEWNFRFPFSPEHPDADFGDSPQIYTLANGKKVVGAGQKSGFYHVLDAQTGALINQNQVEVGGTLGGLFADTAVANGVVFANGINWPNPGGPPGPQAGDLIAISGDASQVLWDLNLPFSPIFGGVATANSVVYCTSTYGPYGSNLYAVDAVTGTVLKTVNIGLSASGPSVSRGQVYVGTGDALLVGFGLGLVSGTITALGL